MTVPLLRCCIVFTLALMCAGWNPPSAAALARRTVSAALGPSPHSVDDARQSPAPPGPSQPTPSPGGPSLSPQQLEEKRAQIRRDLTRLLELVTWQRWIIVGVGIALVLACLLVLAVRRRERDRRTALDRELRQVQQRILRQQMNPHFVFNALSSIQFFVLNNDRDASNTYITRFSRLMRLILENSQEDMIALSDELSMIELYLELEAMRFRHGFTYALEVPDDDTLVSQTIPAFLLQPYVENAIWHGLATKAESKHVRIAVSRDADRIRCVVEDNGIGRQKAAELRSRRAPHNRPLGTDITKRRLVLLNDLYGRDIDVGFTDLTHPNGDSAGTRVEITLTTES